MHDTRLIELLQSHPAWCVWQSRPNPEPGKKPLKVPVSPLDPTGPGMDPHSPANWLSGRDALAYATMLGDGYGVGIILYPGCGLFCIDLDKALDAAGMWKPHVGQFGAKFPGAYQEVSFSRTGGHIIGRTAALEHGTRCSEFHMELYTQLRFVAITGEGATGDPNTDHTAALASFAAEYFPPKPSVDFDWTYGPVPEWSGPATDEELVARALRFVGVRAMFGSSLPFSKLYHADDEAALSKAFPPDGAGAWNASGLDQAIANHYAYWTGKDCERMLGLMWKTEALVRAKWSAHATYLRRTVLEACAGTKEVCANGSKPDAVAAVSVALTPTWTIPPAPGYDVANVAHTPTGKDVQATAPDSVQPGVPPPPAFYIPPPPEPKKRAGSLKVGEILSSSEMADVFEGFTYIHELDKVQHPDGRLSDKKRFDSWLAGVNYSQTFEKMTPSAWDAFVNSEIFIARKAWSQYFNPLDATGTLRERGGRVEVNSYRPAIVRSVEGDPGPFIGLVTRMLPHGRDAEILLSYMSACVRYIGTKFMWCPFIQGTKGNGKSTMGEIMRYCIGSEYTHTPRADQLTEKFNAVFADKIFIVVDEIQTVSDREDKTEFMETMKNFVTSTQMEVRAMYTEKRMAEVCFNLMLISNHLNAIRVDTDERRYAPLFCAQQKFEHLARDGLTNEYFINLRAWLNGDGFSITYNYLKNVHVIADDVNPAGECIRAPKTSSSGQATSISVGAIEQEVAYCIAQQMDGFKGGWLSSVAFDAMLARKGKDKYTPRNRRAEIVMALGYVPHPSLPAGQSNTPLAPTQERPIIYIRPDHHWAVAGLTDAQVMDGYLQFQKL